jgi:hypothetical protein
MTTEASRRPIASRSVAVLLVVLSFTALVVVGDPGVAQAADPEPIPADLWDTNPDVPDGTSYIAIRREPAGYSSPTTVPGSGAEVDEHVYTKANASIELREEGGRIGFEIWQDGRKFLWLSALDWAALTTGFHEPARVDWSSCAVDTQAWIAVDEIERGTAGIESLTVRYGQHCAGDGSTLMGKVHWNASDATVPSGPTPIPDGLWDMPAPVDAGQSYVLLDGDVDDPAPWRGTHVYTKADSRMAVELEGRALGISIEGDEDWGGQFVGMSSIADLEAGYYGSLLYPNQNPATGGLSWSGEGRTCTDATGWFAVDEIERGPASSVSLTLRFGFVCDGRELNGKIHWDSTDATEPPGPVAPIPSDLWDVEPEVGEGQTYVAVEGVPGDPVTAGQSFLFTKADADIALIDDEPQVRVIVRGDDFWSGSFAPMERLSSLATGFYPQVQREPFGNPTLGGLSWSGPFGGCNKVDGWMAVDELTRSAGTIESVTIRFHQICVGGHAIRGKIRWIASDTTEPPGPVSPVPADLWDAAPPTGESQSYVALESPVGDPIGNAANELYTKANSVMLVDESSEGRITVSVKGDVGWNGSFTPMSSLEGVEVGYYRDLVGRVNPARGSAKWASESRHCNWATGWFAVDEVTRTNGSLTSLTLRFEQSCEDGPALHGKIRWNAADTTVPPGPENPVPGDLWDSMPDVGADQSFLALEGDAGGALAGAPHELYTKANSLLSVSESNGSLTVGADGDQAWSATFVPKVSSGPISLGLYRDAVLTPSKNTTRNTMKVHLTRGPTGPESCTTADGWFAVDELARTGSTITSATFRFAYTCDGTNTLHGKFRWNASDPTTGPGPVQPIPDGLWDVVTPDGAAEDWVYLEADPADPVSGGIAQVVVNSLYPPFVGDWENTLVLFAGEGDEGWMGTFERPGDGFVEAGFYPNLSSSTWANPVKGGLELERSDGTRCGGEITGWFAVDSIERIDGQVTKLDLRFEQSCGGAAPLRGKVHIEDRTPPTTTTSTTTAPATTTTSTTTSPSTSTTTTPPLPVLGLPPGSPRGSIDMAAGGAGAVKVRGWALDPDTGSSIAIRVSLDGRSTTFTASASRPDVGSAFAGYGPLHGFDLSLPTTSGAHRVCVTAVDQGVGSNKGLGCRDVNVLSGSPFGSFDSLVGGTGALRVTGWAIDPDTEVPVRVRVLVDGVATTVMAGSSRPDVAAAFPGYGSMRGFNGRIVASKGAHTVCVSALDIGPGSNKSFGCRTVTVR